MRSVFVAIILLASAVSLSAHPGHGTGDGESVQHYVTSPLHAAPVVAGLMTVLAVGGWVSVRRLRRARAQAAAVKSVPKR